jgi:Ca2+-binding EF-hand superfamily protein
VPLTPFQRHKLRRMFSVWDVNHDGHIDQSDYLRRVEAFARLRGWTEESPEYTRNLEFARQEWQALLESADADEDGSISVDDFLRYGDTFLDDREAVRAYARGDVQLMFDGMDIDGDGRISLDEYRTYLEVCGVETSAAARFFAHADLDGNGSVSRDEMRHAVEEFLVSENPDSGANVLFGPLAPMN